MKLTVVTAVFNAIASGNRENLIRCVKSVAALKTEHEHLIYDGGSTDGTVELLRELVKEVQGERSSSGVDGLNSDCRAHEGSESSSSETKSESGISDTHSSTWTLDLNCHSRLRVTSEPDTGIYNALNKGVRDAKGEWFYVLGCDDYICHPDVLDNYLSSVTDDVHVIAATLLRQQYTNVKKGDARESVFRWFTKLEDLKIVFSSIPVGHQGEILRTSIVRKLGGFDEHYKIAADADMLLKAHDMGLNFQYKFSPFAFFSAGGTADSNEAKSRQELYSVLSKHLRIRQEDMEKWCRQQLLPIRSIVRYLYHRDLAYRIAARWMAWRIVKPYIRVFLYPIVFITRPIRYKLHEGYENKGMEGG